MTQYNTLSFSALGSSRSEGSAAQVKAAAEGYGTRQAKGAESEPSLPHHDLCKRLGLPPATRL